MLDLLYDAFELIDQFSQHQGMHTALFIHVARGASADWALVIQALLAEDMLTGPHDHHFYRNRVAESTIKVLFEDVLNARDCRNKPAAPLGE